MSVNLFARTLNGAYVRYDAYDSILCVCEKRISASLRACTNILSLCSRSSDAEYARRGAHMHSFLIRGMQSARHAVHVRSSRNPHAASNVSHAREHISMLSINEACVKLTLLVTAGSQIISPGFSQDMEDITMGACFFS